MTSSKPVLRSGNHPGCALWFTEVRIDGGVLSGHAVGRKPFFEHATAFHSIQVLHFFESLHSLILVGNHESRLPLVYDLRYRTERISDDWCAASHGLDHS